MEEKGGLNCSIMKDGKVILYYLPASIEGGKAPRLLIGIYGQKPQLEIENRAYCLLDV